MTPISKSTPIGREAYLKRYIETSERLNMAEDETVQGARREYLEILNCKLNRAVISATRAVLGRQHPMVSAAKTIFKS